MSELSRRDFLKASAGAVGASVAASRVQAAPEKSKVGLLGSKVFVIFSDTNPSADDTSIVPVSDTDLLARLRENCPGTEFVTRDLKRAGALESILNEMRDLKTQGYDGVLLFGAPRHYGLTETGLPTLVVYSIHDFMNIPYVIMDHRERSVRAHSKPGVGACTSVLYPPNEPGTIWRIDIMTKDVLVHTGTTIANPTAQAMGLTAVPSPYKPHWNETMCRTKFAIKVKDAKKIERYVYPDRYGVHRSGTLGDHRERVKNLAALIGLRVIEEDA